MQGWLACILGSRQRSRSRQAWQAVQITSRSTHDLQGSCKQQSGSLQRSRLLSVSVPVRSMNIRGCLLPESPHKNIP